MRLRRSRRRNLTVLSTRAAPGSGVRPAAWPARRRRLRFARTGMLLAVLGVVRLARTARVHWRISLALSGILLEALGHAMLSGPAQGTADLIGLAVVAVAVLKSEGPAEPRRRAVSQTAWRWQG